MRRCTPAKSRLPSSESSRLDGAARRAARGPRRSSGSSAISRWNRCRRAISKETRATSHGRRGTLSGRSIAADLEHEDPGRAELDGPADRDRVHDAAVEVVLVADPGRRQQPGYGGARDDRVDHRAGVEPVLGGPLDAGRADLEPDRQLLEGDVAELLAQPLLAAAWRSRCGCRWSTARRTVRSGRSPYTSRLLSLAPRHSSVSRSITASDGSRATIAPLSAPTLVPSTRSGVIAALEERPQHADLDRAEDAPAAEHERGRHRRQRLPAADRRTSSGCSARTLGDPVLGPEDQQRDGPATAASRA